MNLGACAFVEPALLSDVSALANSCMCTQRYDLDPTPYGGEKGRRVDNSDGIESFRIIGSGQGRCLL